MVLNNKVDEFKDDLIKDVQEIVKIKSVEGEPEKKMPFGEGPAKALKCVLNISEKLGFKTVNLDNYIAYAEYGEGEDYIGVLGHIDVVPEGDGWDYPPFGAEIHDGKIYGRGTTDDKGPIIAALYGLKAIKDCNIKLSKKVRIIFGTNEETGCREISHYLKNEKPPIMGFTPDAEYPIINGEKGITIFNLVKDLNVKSQEDIKIKYIIGGQRPNIVADYCEVGIEANDKYWIKQNIEDINKKFEYNIETKITDDLIIIKCYGKSAHGSTPELGENAIMQMFRILYNIHLPSCDIVDYIDFFAKNVGMDTSGKGLGVDLEDDISGKLSFNIGTVNANEDKIIMSLNLRYPVSFSLEDMLTPLKESLKGTGIIIENMMHQPPLYFDPEHELIKKLKKVYYEQTGDSPELLSIGGGTYAKEMPNIVAFGPIFPGKPDLDHQANEYIEIEDLVLNSKIYAHAIYELAK